MENNKENYDDIDAMVRVVNTAQKTNEALDASKKYDGAIDYNNVLQYQQFRRQLIKERENEKKKSNSAMKKFIAKLLIFSTIVTGGAILGDKIVDNAKKSKTIEDARNSLIDEAREHLVDENLAFYDDNGKFVMKENKASDYNNISSQFKVSDDVLVYVFNKAMSNKEEIDKFMQTISFDGVNCYESFEQFLRMKGYYKVGTTNTSYEVFENYMENCLYEAAMQEGTISSYDNQEYYTSDLENNNYKSR